jgi:hypothetical protein
MPCSALRWLPSPHAMYLRAIINEARQPNRANRTGTTSAIAERSGSSR